MDWKKLHKNPYFQLLSKIIAIIVGFIIIFNFVQDNFLYSAEEYNKITVKSNINKLINVRDMINFSDFELSNIYPDIYKSSKTNKNLYNQGEEIIYEISTELTGKNSHHISAILTDNNGYVRMTFPSMDDISLNRLLDRSLSFSNIVNNDANTEINQTKTKFTFITKNPESVVSKGTWRINVIYWKNINGELEPTLIIGEDIDFSNREQITIDFSPMVFTYFLIPVLIIVAIVTYEYLKRKNK